MTQQELLDAILKRYPNISEALSWRPMETAPRSYDVWVLVMTSHGNVEAARYIPDRNGQDSWGRDNVRFMCRGWLPITAVADRVVSSDGIDRLTPPRKVTIVVVPAITSTISKPHADDDIIVVRNENISRYIVRGHHVAKVILVGCTRDTLNPELGSALRVASAVWGNEAGIPYIEV